MIGWYVHHQGLGHLHRARAVFPELAEPVTVLSSLPRPDDWDVAWIALPRDDTGEVRDPDAGCQLHWAPLGHDGLRSRMASVSSWIAEEKPDLVVCDVSVEVALLARLHGVPVLCVAMPGDRSDAAHRLGYAISAELVGCWPREVDDLVAGIRDVDTARIRPVGALSRFPVATPSPRRPGPPRVVLLMGAGGRDLSVEELGCARRQTPEWEWTVLDPTLGTWLEDPYLALCEADVVVTHAGQNAVAEVAAARRPAVVVPAVRPHGEQRATGRALESGPWPVLVRDTWPSQGWSSLLHEASALDGSRWDTWCDGKEAARFAGLVREASRAARVRA
jgi:glycosyl transferase family 28